MKLRFTFIIFCFSLLSVNGQTRFLTNPKIVTQILEAIEANKTAASFTPAQSVGADALWANGYEGAGLYAGMWEAYTNGKVNENLSDLQGTSSSRVTIQEGSAIQSHSNGVARVLASDGTASGIDKGVAPKALILSYMASGDEFWPEMDAVSYPKGTGNDILVANHSFAANAGWNANGSTYWHGVFQIDEREDHKFGRYSGEEYLRDNLYDQSIVNNPFLSIVKSAGNDRGQSGVTSIGTPYTQWNYDIGTNTWSRISATLTDPDKPNDDGGANSFDCIPNGATGKNIITVGACQSLMAEYTNKSQIILQPVSTFGPTDDGRIKPDLVAPSGNNTSNAAPVVSGSVLLVQEVYLDQASNSEFMKASTVKALLCHTAFEAENDGPDYKTGWGMVNVEAAGLLIESDEANNGEYIREQSLANSGIDKFFYYIDANATEAKITLAWTDPEGTPNPLTYTSTDLNNPASMLVNDLDVRLKQICAGTEFQPYVLDPANPSVAATTGDNVRDNIEQIHQQSLDAGWYVIEVSHKGTLASTQDYSLIVEGFETPNRWTGSWSKLTAPTSTDVVSVESNLPVGATKIEANHVFIVDGVAITANTSEELEISGNLTTSGTATFSGDGNLKLINDNALVCGNFTISNLVLAKGANTATIEAANSLLEITELLTAESGTLTTNGNLTLKATDNFNQEGYAQVLDLGGTISGDVNAQAFIVNGGNDWRHLSSPVTTTLNNFLQDYDTYYLNTNASVYKWDNTISKWGYVSSAGEVVNSTTAFSLWFGTSGGTKYTDLPHLIELTGPLTTSTVANASSLNYHIGDAADFIGGISDGWNMIANPYPSGLDWSIVEAGFGSNISSFYYIYDAANDNYFSSNSGVIAPFQAFFVKLEDNTANGSTVLDFENSDRTITKTKFLKKDVPQISLKVKSGNSKFDLTSIRFNELATDEFDLKFDAYKLNSPDTKVPRFYSTIVKDNGSIKSCINTTPLPTDKSVIPIGFESSIGGSQTISLDSFYLDNPLDIWLLDNLTKSRTNLLESSYQFAHNPANEAGRFTLFLGPELSEDEIAISDDPLIYVKNESLIISGFETSQRVEISVFNMLGQTVFDGVYMGSESISIPLENIQATGAVIVSYESRKTIVRKKLILPN
jgi:hypothetical protein